VLDSTALYDAVATQDTVTMIRGAIRALLGEVDGTFQNEQVHSRSAGAARAGAEAFCLGLRRTR
jgi:hypothetical protein